MTGTPPKLTLDLNYYAHRQQHGSIVVFITWQIDTGDPAIVLIPAIARQHHDSLTPCVVSLEDAWVWSEEIGDKQAAMFTAKDYAKTLGFPSHDVGAAHRVRSIITGYIGDLIALPHLSESFAPTAHVADILVRDINTGAEKHVKVNSHER